MEMMERSEITEENIRVRMYAVAVSAAEMFYLMITKEDALEKMMLHDAPPRLIAQRGFVNVLLYMTPNEQTKAHEKIRKMFRSARKIDTPAFVPGEMFQQSKDKQAFKEEAGEEK